MNVNQARLSEIISNKVEGGTRYNSIDLSLKLSVPIITWVPLQNMFLTRLDIM